MKQTRLTIIGFFFPFNIFFQTPQPKALVLLKTVDHAVYLGNIYIHIYIFIYI